MHSPIVLKKTKVQENLDKKRKRLACLYMNNNTGNLKEAVPAYFNRTRGRRNWETNESGLAMMASAARNDIV